MLSERSPEAGALTLTIVQTLNAVTDSALQAMRTENAVLRALLAPVASVPILASGGCDACVQATRQIRALQACVHDSAKLRASALKQSVRLGKLLQARESRIARLKTKLAATERLLREAEITIVRLQRRAHRSSAKLRVVT